MQAGSEHILALALFVWLAVLLTFLGAAAALFFSSRSLHLSITSAWRRPQVSERMSLRPLMLAIAMAIAAALLLLLSSGTSAGVRITLVVLAAGALGITLEWSWKASHQWTARRARQHREWSARATEACAEIEKLFDPAEIAATACRLLRSKLGYSHATLYLENGGRFELAASTAAEPLTPTLELAQGGRLRARLTEFPTFHGLTIVDSESGQPRAWDKLAAPTVTAEQAMLTGVDAHYVVPLQRDYALSGVFILGPAEGGPALLTHAETIAVESARALGNAEHARAFYERVAEASHEQASRRTARAAREHLAPAGRLDLRGLSFARAAWYGDSPGGVCYDAVALGDTAGAFFLAEIDGPVEDAAVRLVQLQALLRSRAAASPNDCALWLESTREAIALSAANRPPVRLFAARYDDSRRQLDYSNAGHLAPLLLRHGADGSELLRLSQGSAALGESAGPVTQAQQTLVAGDVLLLVSSGVVEAAPPHGEPWGEARLVETLLDLDGEPASEIAAAILKAAADHSGPGREGKPRIVLVLKARPEAPEAGDSAEPAPIA